MTWKTSRATAVTRSRRTSTPTKSFRPSSVAPEAKAVHLEEAHNSESVVVVLAEVDSATEWLVEPVQWVGLAV